ncbi:uncharacterized protein PG986_000116 [Apiospora aurea]|uniref:Uncharacterized protein n=1 Tax=Apiospora aurea TaxID=335848 RepID=A0ABR1QT35_9PEZI
MFIPSRAGLSILQESLSIAQQCFYHAALDEWPFWTRDLFPQGAHEVSFGALDLLGYFAGYSVGDGDFAMRGAGSCEVFHALMDMTDLRNRTCHFPPRSDAHYLRTVRGGRRHRTPQTAAEEVRYAIEEEQRQRGMGAGMGSGNWPFEPDCAGWYCETMAAARNLARVLDDEAAMRALDDLYGRVEDQAWAMLCAVEEIAAVRAGVCGEGHNTSSNEEEEEEGGEEKDRRGAMMRAVPEELLVPIDMFFQTVEVRDRGWPEIIRQAAVVWSETNGYNGAF